MLVVKQKLLVDTSPIPIISKSPFYFFQYLTVVFHSHCTKKVPSPVELSRLGKWVLAAFC